MSQVMFNQVNTFENKGTTQLARVGWFNSLKNDGDEILVRFNYASTEDFHLATIHKVNIDGKFRSVSCVRNFNDPKDDCPLCASGNKVATKIFVELLEYVPTEDGKYVPEAKVWERPFKFAQKLATYIKEWGDLRDVVFKIIRKGQAGSMQTDYDIVPVKQDFYAPLCPANFEDFKDCKIEGRFYLTKSYEELQDLVGVNKTETVFNTKEETSETQVKTPTISQPSSTRPQQTVASVLARPKRFNNGF